MAFAAAHRGLSATVSENTVAALQEARDAGFPAIEIDVRVTSDGEVVILHDDGVDRTTDGKGRVSSLRYDELASLRTPDGPVPRLVDALAALRDWHGTWIVEVKARRATVASLDLFDDANAADLMVLSSMDPQVLRAARRHASDVPRALIVLGAIDRDDIDAARRQDATWIHADHHHLDAPHIDKAVDAGLRVGAWTVNDPGEAKRLVEEGVECIITDTDAVLRAL